MSNSVQMSVICVYNNDRVFQECLQASLGAHPSIELIAIDNRTQTYSSAGAALNAGARQAHAPVLVFCHQDVYFLDVDSLVKTAQWLEARPDIALVGPVGMDHGGTVRGCIVDRFVQIGTQEKDCALVDSLDEVLFMTTTSHWQTHPVTEEPRLSWHGYAVEYGLWWRRHNLSVCAAPIPVIHHSASSNLKGLKQAHQYLARQYEDYLPIHTSTATITRQDLQHAPLTHRGLMRRLQQFLRSRWPAWYPVDIREPDAFIQSLHPSHVHVVSPVACRISLTGPISTVHRGSIPFTYWHIPQEDFVRRVDQLLGEEKSVVIASHMPSDLCAPLCGEHVPLRMGTFGQTGSWAIFGPLRTSVAR